MTGRPWSVVEMWEYRGLRAIWGREEKEMGEGDGEGDGNGEEEMGKGMGMGRREMVER